MTKLLLICLLSLSGAAFAATTPSSALSTTVVTAVPPTPPKFSGSIGIGRSNSLYIVNGQSPIASWDFSGSLGYKMSPMISSVAVLEGSEDINVPEDSEIGKVMAGLTFHKDQTKQPLVDMSYSTFVGVPSTKAQHAASFKGLVQLGAKASIGSDYLFSKKLALIFGVSGTRNFHDYDTAISGKVNKQYSASESITAGWNFTDAISLSVVYTHFNYWSYQGAMTEYFNHTEELGYVLNKSWSVALGHSYGAPLVSVWKADHQTYNTNLTDEDNSVVYGSIGYTF